MMNIKRFGEERHSGVILNAFFDNSKKLLMFFYLFVIIFDIN